MRRPLLLAAAGVGILVVVCLAVLLPLGLNNWGRKDGKKETSVSDTSSPNVTSLPSPTSSSTTPPSSTPAPRILSLVANSPRNITLPDRVNISVTITPEASASELSTITWRVLSGPGTFWYQNMADGGNAIAEFTKSGTYILEARITSITGDVSLNQTTILVTRPTAVRFIFEGELPVRTNQRASVGPRVATDDQGNIYVAYVDRNLNTTVAQRRFGDDPNQWTITPIGPAKDEENHCKPAIATDSQGYIHVVYAFSFLSSSDLTSTGIITMEIPGTTLYQSTL